MAAETPLIPAPFPAFYDPTADEQRLLEASIRHPEIHNSPNEEVRISGAFFHALAATCREYNSLLSEVLELRKRHAALVRAVERLGGMS